MGNLFENKTLEISAEGVKIVVSEYTVNDQQVFRLLFSDGRLPLVITRISALSSNLWTSIPQGRQKEAESFGKEISKHL
ncbi:hypothetical protein DRF60_06360 [Chryseobacterium elymi]|uniref:Uncharacterized protein n=1 Tax=Chryseobacterium elymi TaxID=395936 RepID=A0A3D9DN68_9FLAO|nr:hypothetical protein DRF60_06360 [Chryseobacterium elymi]